MMFALYFLIPYLFGFAAAVDSSGRGATLIGATFLLSLPVGPYFGGLVAEHFGYRMIGTLIVAAGMLAMAILIASHRAGRPRDPSVAAADSSFLQRAA